MASITMENIGKSFGQIDVLKGINLKVHDGEFISLLGSSGCGKSTLLRIISGLEKQSSGRLFIGDKDMENVFPKNRSVSMVFQSYALYPHLTVFENMAVPLVMRKLTRLQRLPLAGRFLRGTSSVRQEIRDRVHRLAETLDIHALLDRKPAQLSGGQRQRVALGRAMVREPQVFLMDEPLSNLDTKMRAHMRTELAEIHRNLGATFVYVTHDQEEAMTMSDRVALMIDGQILQVATPREIYRSPVHRKVAEFIGSPRINILPGIVTDPEIMEVCGMKCPAPKGLHGKCFIGIRPSRLIPSEQPAGSWKARVTNVEDLGSSFLIHSTLAEDVKIISRMDSRSAIPQVGDEVYLKPQPGCAMFFDSEGWNHNLSRELPAQKVPLSTVGFSEENHESAIAI